MDFRQIIPPRQASDVFRWLSSSNAFLLLATVAFALLITVPLGFFELMSSFDEFGDEGYMMAIFQGLALDKPLYTEVYSQYGPFFSLFWTGLIDLVPSILTHTGSRLSVLVIWLASSFAVGGFIFRVTRNLAFSFLAVLATFFVLLPLDGQPFHPVSLTALLLSLLILASSVGRVPPSKLGTALIGVILACAMMVKINVGLLALAGLVLALILVYGPRHERNGILYIFLIGLIVISPLLVMYGDVTQVWVQRFGLLVAFSTLSIVITCYPSLGRLLSSTESSFPFLSFSLGFGLSVTLILSFIFFDGTSLAGLVEGVVLEPLRTSDALLMPLSLAGGALDLGLLGLGLALFFRLSSKWSESLVIPFRLFVGSLIIWSSLDPNLGGFLPTGFPTLGLSLPFIWAIFLTSSNDSTGGPWRQFSFPIVFLVCLAVMISVHLYPVAGTQLAVSSFLLVPVGLLTIFRSWPSAPVNTFTLRTSSVVALIIVAVFTVKAGIVYLERYSTAYFIYRDNRPLDANGTRLLRLEGNLSQNLEDVASALKRDCDTFYSIPGMNSFYTLAELPLATTLNANNWGALLSNEQQSRALKDLRALQGQRLCVVTHSKNIGVQEGLWQRAYSDTDQRLVRFLESNRRLILRSGDYRVYLKVW